MMATLPPKLVVIASSPVFNPTAGLGMNVSFVNARLFAVLRPSREIEATFQKSAIP
jgi:hypothetical protein